MDHIKYFYPNGCFCGGELKFNVQTFTYQCQVCGAYASAHREKTEFSEKYEPYQYLATPEVNALRKTLNKYYQDIWRERVERYYPEKNKSYEDLLINVIYPENIRLLISKIEDDPIFVKVISGDKDKGTCNVYCFDNGQIIEGINYSELISVSNKTKALIWLSEKLGISYPECRIGYLSSTQLKQAIKICTKFIAYARQRAIETHKNRPGST